MLSWLFIKKKAETKTILNNNIISSEIGEDNGNKELIQQQNHVEQLPAYSEITTQAQQTLVSIIMASIAANDQLTSQFVVKRVLQRNPEVELVALIATSLAAADQPESQFRLKRIVRSA